MCMCTHVWMEVVCTQVRHIYETLNASFSGKVSKKPKHSLEPYLVAAAGM